VVIGPEIVELRMHCGRERGGRKGIPHLVWTCSGDGEGRVKRAEPAYRMAICVVDLLWVNCGKMEESRPRCEARVRYGCSDRLTVHLIMSAAEQHLLADGLAE
jgi:hypothetical protein